jgi:hypothetical protein
MAHITSGEMESLQDKKYRLIWNRFVIKSNKNRLEYPVNFLGSVAHHKKLFYEAINEIERENIK